jgi:molybdopterin-guanine dinucleotide biosynthesis protein A
MHDNLPLVLVGGAKGRLGGGRHLAFPKGTPVTNLFLSMLDKLGVPADTIGDSSGRLEDLSDV